MYSLRRTDQDRNRSIVRNTSNCFHFVTIGWKYKMWKWSRVACSTWQLSSLFVSCLIKNSAAEPSQHHVWQDKSGIWIRPLTRNALGKLRKDLGAQLGLTPIYKWSISSFRKYLTWLSPSGTRHIFQLLISGWVDGEQKPVEPNYEPVIFFV